MNELPDIDDERRHAGKFGYEVLIEKFAGSKKKILRRSTIDPQGYIWPPEALQRWQEKTIIVDKEDAKKYPKGLIIDLKDNRKQQGVHSRQY